MSRKLFIIFLSTFILGLTLAEEPNEVYPFEDSLNEERFLSLLNELRCPKCQGSNLAGSNAPIAIDLKSEVYRLVKLGKTEEEVKAYLVDRYGNFIDYDPPFYSGTYALWLAPLMIFLITLLAILFRRVFNNNKNNR